MPLIRDSIGIIQSLHDLYQHLQDPDKDKRDLATRAFLEDPNRFQALVNSPASDSLSTLQGIVGQNARWGGNSNASSNLINTIQNAPLSGEAQAKRTEALQNANVNDSNFAKTFAAATRGMSPEQKADYMKNAYAGMRDGTSDKPSYLTQDQKDINSISDKLPTDLAKKDINTKIGLDQSLTDQNKSNTKRIDQEVDSKQRELDATSLIDNWKKDNPNIGNKSPHDLFFSNDPSVPQQVKDAIPLSSKYSPAFKAQFEKNIEDLRTQSENDRIKMEKGRLAFDEQTQQNLFSRQANQLAGGAWKDSNFIGGQSGFKGFQDIYSGKPDTPEAQGVVKLAGAKATQGMIKQYNDELNRIMAEAPKMSADGINAALLALNQQGAGLSAFGIKKEPLVYGPQKSDAGGLSGFAQRHTPDMFKGNTIQTQSGGKPSPVIDETDEIKQKHDRWEAIHKENPNIPADAITARVEAEFSKNKKK